MLGTVLVMLIVIAVGARSSDAIVVRQQEIILGNLPEKDAIAYYQFIRKRARKVAILRVIALCSLVVLFYSYKHHLAAAGMRATVIQKS